MSVRCFELHPEKFKGKIPFVVTDIVRRLEVLHVQDQEGIFRLAGSDLKAKALTEILNKGPIKSWSPDYDVHTVGTVFKRYFRYLADKDPLIPFDLYDAFLCLMVFSENGELGLVENSRTLVNSMSESRKKTLSFLIRFLKTVADRSETNKMTAKNIAICFAPNLVAPRKGDGERDQLKENALVNKLVENMITHCDEIFADIPINEDDFCTEEEIAAICAEKLNMAKVNHLIVRNKLRENSVIPYAPMCRVEVNEIYERPTGRPCFADEEGPSEVVQWSRRRFISYIDGVQRRNTILMRKRTPSVENDVIRRSSSLMPQECIEC